MPECVNDPLPPAPWADGVSPTPEEWRAFYLGLSEGWQVALAKRVLANAETANRCFVAYHEGLHFEVRDLREQVGTLTKRLMWSRLAWLSACRRARRLAAQPAGHD